MTTDRHQSVSAEALDPAMFHEEGREAHGTPVPGRARDFPVDRFWGPSTPDGVHRPSTGSDASVERVRWNRGVAGRPSSWGGEFLSPQDGQFR